MKWSECSHFRPRVCNRQQTKTPQHPLDFHHLSLILHNRFVPETTVYFKSNVFRLKNKRFGKRQLFLLRKESLIFLTWGFIHVYIFFLKIFSFLFLMGLTNVFSFSIYVSNIYYLTNKNLFNKSQLFVKETNIQGRTRWAWFVSFHKSTTRTCRLHLVPANLGVIGLTAKSLM